MQALPISSYPEQIGFYTHDGSDKEYRIRIQQEQNGQYRLLAHNGRRGRCTTLARTQYYNDFTLAVKDANALRLSKEKKGYVFAGNVLAASTPISTDPNKIDTGLRPQLLNPIRRDQSFELISNDDWCSQQKFNGVNITIDTQHSGKITYANKLGYPTSVPQGIDQVLAQFPPLRATGELIGDRLVLYDLQWVAGVDLSRVGYLDRIKSLAKIVQSFSHHLTATGQAVVFVARTAETTQEKQQLMDNVAAACLEGEVYKYKYGLWRPGRPNSGGDQLKCKNWKSATCIVVADNNPVRSIKVGVYETAGAAPTVIGNVTVKANQSIPAVGAFVEVKYLDYFPGGSLTQPELLFERIDVDDSSCTLSQLVSLGKD